MSTHTQHYHGRHRKAWTKKDTCGALMALSIAVLWFLIISYWMMNGLPK